MMVNVEVLSQGKRSVEISLTLSFGLLILHLLQQVSVLCSLSSSVFGYRFC